ncbi:holin [Streptomyces kronopolitis]|uniref:holin n=1 Tax=Streptomyces kronopolitis TaxID=1612435 RepID=UPI003422915B
MPNRSTEPVEAKVKAAASIAGVLALIVTVLNAAAESPLLGDLPPWLQGAILLLAPPLATFYAAWKARHTPRGVPPEQASPFGLDGEL